MRNSSNRRSNGNGNRGGGRGGRRNNSDNRGGRGGRGARGRGGRGGGGGGGGRGRGRGRGRGQRRNSQAHSGNQRERIQVESGYLVLIDQFMLANPKLLDELREKLDADPDEKNPIVEKFGGTVVSVEPATYRIARDPYALTIVIHQDGEEAEAETITDRASKEGGHVFIDTRCLAMIDRELLDDIALLEKYNQLWFSGQDKACRDLLRDNGGAVRYGFQRFGDELGVFSVPEENTVALWPDVKEEVGDEDGEETPAEAAAEASESAESAAA